MKILIDNIVLFVVTFAIIFLLYYVFVVMDKRKLKKYANSVEVTYLKRAYKLDVTKIDMKKLATSLAVANALIIAIDVTLIGFVSNLILKLLIAFILLFPLIVLAYSFVADKYNRKARKK